MTDPKSLPVWQNRQEILDALRTNNVIIVESPTGSGKTTQIPLILKEAGLATDKIIGITQPRRIATLGVCSYIRQNLKEISETPSYCAYKMRFYDTTDSSTRIKILTDGMLLQELKADPLLSSYGVIMVDEAHERSLNIDFILGMLKEILNRRNGLKVIISSATLNTKAFAGFFGFNGTSAPIISIKARNYSVETKYFPIKDKAEDSNSISHCVTQILNVHMKKFKERNYKNPEDTLVFLSGELDIKTTLAAVYSNCDYTHMQIYTLYGRMNKEEQEQVFEETQSGKMKVVLATNIAETSLTIDGIKLVIDSGLCKMNFYNQYDFTSSLVTKKISRSSAQQRTGRAGRTSNGICYRLYSEEDFKGRSLYTQEEILRTDLSEVVLRMVDLGIYDFENFNFITKPDKKALQSGENTLKIIGAIDSQRHLTTIGNLMVRFPLLPRHSRCLVQAIMRDTEMIWPTSVCLAFLSCKTPFILPVGEEDQARSAHKRFSSQFGDFVGYQILFEKYIQLESSKSKEDFCFNNYLDKQSMDEIVHVANQLVDITGEMEIPIPARKVTNEQSTVKRLMLCIISGLIQYVCIKKENSVYRTLLTDEIYIHPGSAWFRKMPDYILAGEIVMTSKMYARTVSPLDYDWISSVSPETAQRLKKLPAKNNNKVETTNNRKSSRQTEFKKTINVYGFELPLVFESGKKGRSVAVIEAKDLASLSKAFRKASRKPKNIVATVKLGSYYLLYGERITDIVRLSTRVALNEQSIVKKIPETIFYPDTLDKLESNVDLIMCLSTLSKHPDRLGFIEIVTSKNRMFFHVTPSFTDAINNTAYSLLTALDAKDSKVLRKAYNSIIRLLD